MSTTRTSDTLIHTVPAQYLFRVYHDPITFTDVSRLKGPVFTGDGELPGEQFGFELNYNDHLFSLPPTVENMVATANSLAYAESLLYVNNHIHFIAVWMVDATKQIDHSTPVVVLFPANSQNPTFPEMGITIDGDRRYLQPPTRPEWIPRYTNDSPTDLSENSFASYDLVSSELEGYISDPFITLDVARAATSGRCRRQWFRAVLGRDDYYFNNTGKLHLTRHGSVSMCRFPYFAEVLAQMPFTHSGYEIDQYGQLTRSAEGLTERVANLAIDSSLQRRQFILRNAWLEKVWQRWFICVRNCLALLDAIAREGWPQIETAEYFVGGPTQKVSYAHCPDYAVWQILNEVHWLLNLIGIACGNNGLACDFPFHTIEDPEDVYNVICGDLGMSGGMPLGARPVLYADSTNGSWKCFLQMCDQWGACCKRLRDYGGATGFPSISDIGLFGDVGNIDTLYVAAVHQGYACQYEGLQNQLQALVASLCTWQFMFKPYEPSKNRAHSDRLKTARVYSPRFERYDRENRASAAAAHFPHIDDGLLSDVPVMIGPRSWSVQCVEGDLSGLYSETAQALKRAEYMSNLDIARAQFEDAQAARRAAHADATAAQIAAISAGGGTNPLDPWDWRNWTRREFWLTVHAPEDIIPLAANALNTPSLIDVAVDVFNVSEKTSANLKRLEAPIGAVAFLVYPAYLFRGAIKNVAIRQAVHQAGTRIERATVSAFEDRVKTRALVELGADNPAYEPRDFWPDDEDPTSPTNLPPDPMTGAGTNFGLGESGGGGVGATW